VRLEEDPIARELLQSANLMRLAYVGTGGQPRVVPIWWRYHHGEFVVVTGPHADKVRHLSQRPKVAFTIDTATPPYHVLLVEGDAELEDVEGMAPEYPEIVSRFLGPFADTYLGRMRERVKRQVRIRIRPRSWRTLDFTTRFPKSLR
jgi:PPOX class probable F420-dependent enzyme